ncbi:hypothetical protein KFE98_07605 [bacterium SCSIO 12741]|nr:hypothetical protein KFE98_07605 [bacterium SCSIO 12741]
MDQHEKKFLVTPHQSLLQISSKSNGEECVEEFGLDEFIQKAHRSIEQEEEDREFVNLMINQVY